MIPELLSQINSEAARNGYKEEENVCGDLRDRRIREALNPILGNDYNDCNRIQGNHKCDIQSENKILTAQVKKYQTNIFQQLDRHWVSDLVRNIPGLNDALEILQNLFEKPLLENGTHVDRSKKVKKLCESNYSREILNNFLEVLNSYKKQILEYVFLGTNLEMQPDYLFSVEYIDNIRSKIVVFKIQEIISYLETLDFRIGPRKTTIWLGDEGIISLQRKGGDCGEKSSNQLQTKIILSKLIGCVPYAQHDL